MKKSLLTIVLLLGAFGLSMAQKYVPLDTWPYVFEDFRKGVVVTKNAAAPSEYEYNICVNDGSLHFIKGDVIMKAEMASVNKLKVGEEVFVNVSGKMYKVLVENENGCVLENTMLNYDLLGKTEIGYGISSNTASSTSYNAVSGVRSELINKPLVDLKTEKFGGKEIPVETSKWLYVSGKLVKASKYELSNCPGIEKSELNSFLKSNKIKWNNAESLSSLLIFLKSQFEKQ